MSVGNWKNISGYLQGDISYDLRKVLVTPIYIEFELTAFGERWQSFDIAFEYRADEREEWLSNAVITETTAEFLRSNKLYGLTASKYGETHKIVWQYSGNDLFYSDTPQIRLRFLPRVRVFSSGSYHSISSVYGEGLADLDGLSRHNCIGIDQNGNYMCVGASVFYIIDSLDAEEYSSSSSSSSSSSIDSSSSSSIDSSSSSSSSF